MTVARPLGMDCNTFLAINFSQLLIMRLPEKWVLAHTSSVGYPHHVAQFFALVMSCDFPAAEGWNKNPGDHKCMVPVSGPSGICVGVGGQGWRWPVQPLSTNRKIRWILSTPVVTLAPPEDLLAIPRVFWRVVR